MRHLSMNVVWKTITAINLGQHGLGSSSSVFLMPLGAHTLFCFKGTEFLWLLMFLVSSHTGCLWLLMFFLRLTQDAFGSSCFCFYSHNRMPLAPHVFVSTHTTGCLWLLMFLFLVTQQDAFGSSCFCFYSQNRMPLAPHVFVSTHRTGCLWLLMFLFLLTEQDALGSSQNRMPLAPHVVVLVQFPNVCFCSKNTAYGEQLSGPQVCNCAKSVFFASFDMGSNVSRPPVPAGRQLSNEDLQELVGRLVSLLPAPVAPPPVPAGSEPPLPPPAAPDSATPASPAMPGDGSEPGAYVRVCEHCGHMSYFRNGVCFNPHCVTCTGF